MIERNQLVEIGRFGKPHGVRGELSATIFELEPDDLRCIFVEIDGLFVPFFITATRTKGLETYLLTIKGIADENQGALLANKTIWALTDEAGAPADDEGFYMSDLIGFSVIDADRTVGVIEDFDDSTENLLFLLRMPGSDRSVYIPAAEDIIEGIDPENKTITMNLPQGLFDL